MIAIGIFRQLEENPLPVCLPSTYFDSLPRLLPTLLTICPQFLLTRVAAMFSLVLM